MDLREMVGVKLAVGFDGAAATPALVKALRELRARSLVAFSRNFASPEQFATLVRDLEGALGWRPLVMVDHEGGRVIRFRTGLTQFPDALTVGRAQSPEQVEAQGATEAKELKAIGVAANLAPCVDVLAAGSDPIIGDRSYGEDPQRVSALGQARIKGLQSHGVAACAKHFPGLGAVPKDPHKELPTIDLRWQALEEIHLPPFKAAIEAGVAMVMSSHVCYPGLGEPPGHPATYSKPLIHGLLRERLKFTGLILSDDLEMGALRSLGTMGQAAVEATRAGHDLLLVCSRLDLAREAQTALLEAYETNALLASDLNVTCERFYSVSEKYNS
jgi:beta-N-acetylhexosaminidase